MQEVLSQYPLAALTGPRQSGKTSFLKSAFPHFRYINLELPDLRAYALKDMRGFLQEYNSHVIFDEAQRLPELFSYLQVLVDERKSMGQFILSGSQNFNLMENITQSLAGRIGILRLLPFDFTELKKAKWLPKSKEELMYKGCYPAVYDRNILPERYYADYVKTYLLRDISQLVNLQNTNNFKRFIKLCAARAGQLINFNDLARDAGVSHTTVRNWLSVLETSYVIFFLQPYYKNYSKRLIKSAKLYFYDVGLLSHLLQIRQGDLSPLHPSWGALFENMMVVEKIKQNEHLAQQRDFYFWRDSHGHEIDLLFEENTILHSIEIKATSTIKNDLFSELDFFEKITSPQMLSKSLIYGGEKSQKRTAYDVISWKNILD